MTRASRTAATLLVGTLASGCYGQFALTRTIYDWNGRATTNKVANSALTWAMIIIPVYPVAGLVDFVVLNTVEFWSGSNPVVALRAPDGALVVKRDGHEYTYRTRGAATEVRRNGVPAMRYFEDGGRVVIQDAAGRPLGTLSAADVARAQRAGRAPAAL